MADDARISKADYIITQLNVQTAKKLCFLVAFFFILFFSVIHWKYGEFFEKII